MSRSRRVRIHIRGAGRGEPRLSRLAQPVENHQADPHTPRTGCRLHGGDVWSAHRQDRRVHCHTRPRRDELRDRGSLCDAGRNADDDDHRAEADQEIEAGPVPDPRRGRDDGADHQVYSPACRGRQHSEPRARGLSPGRGRKARCRPPRISRGHRRGKDRLAADPAFHRATPLGRAQGRPPGGRDDREGQGAGARRSARAPTAR